MKKIVKNQKKHFENLKKYVIIDVVICCGVICMAAGLNLFLIPNKIVTGGVSGLATVLYHLTGVGAGSFVLALNLPLLWYAFRRLGRTMAVRTLGATALLSLCLEATASFPAVTGDGLLAALYGGALVGFGMGLVFRAGASTGGTDLVAMAIRRRRSGAPIGSLVLAVDAVVTALCVTVFRDISLGLYALTALAVCGKVIDWVEAGARFAKTAFIISDQPETLCSALLKQLGRGVTVLEGRGGYSGQKKQTLLCVVARREISRMKQIVQQADPAAFVIVTDAQEVLGEGFQT